MGEQTRAGVGRIAFAGNSLVPVVERSSRIFDLDGAQPGILAGRLVKVSMNANIARIAHTLKLFSIGPGADDRSLDPKTSKIKRKITIMKKIKSTMKIKSKIT